MITTSEQLARVLANALNHAGKDDTLPVLRAVRLEAEGDTLTAVATDRHSLGLDTLTALDTAEPFEFLIHYDAAQRIVKACKSAKGSQVTLTVDGDTLTVSMEGQTVTAARVPGEFPRYRSLIPDTTGETARIALTASQLAKFTKTTAERKTEPLRFYFTGENKPVVVKVGTFVGLLMPCRIQWAEHDAAPVAVAV